MLFKYKSEHESIELGSNTIVASIQLTFVYLHFRNQNQSRLERINGDVHFVQKLSSLKAFNPWQDTLLLILEKNPTLVKFVT